MCILFGPESSVNYPHLKEGACSPAGLQFFPLDGLLGTVSVRATEYNGRSPLLQAA